MKVLANARHVHGDVDLVQVLRGADAREQQRLRRADDSAAEHDLGRGVRLVRGAVGGVLDTDRPAFFQQHAVHARAGGDLRAGVAECRATKLCQALIRRLSRIVAWLRG